MGWSCFLPQEQFHPREQKQTKQKTPVHCTPCLLLTTTNPNTQCSSRYTTIENAGTRSRMRVEAQPASAGATARTCPSLQRFFSPLFVAQATPYDNARVSLLTVTNGMCASVLVVVTAVGNPRCPICGIRAGKERRYMECVPATLCPPYKICSLFSLLRLLAFARRRVSARKRVAQSRRKHFSKVASIARVRKYRHSCAQSSSDISIHFSGEMTRINEAETTQKLRLVILVHPWRESKS